MVVRLAPPGVARRGNIDVLRQVPLLRALASHGIPVATVRWASDDPRWFGTDAFIVDHLRGRTLRMVGIENPVPADEPAGDHAALLDRTVDVLARVHALPWRDGELREWARPMPLDDEFDTWFRALERGGIAEAIRRGGRLRATLTARGPAAASVGVLHGDFQTNNVLYDAGEVVGVVDWELAGIGPQLLDLGWLAMMADPRCWDAAYAERMRVTADPEDLRCRYEHAAGGAVEDFAWYRAFACYRFAAIVSYNLMLHRTGRREDPLYEHLAESIPVLLDRGLELLA